jgi:hypothetical protein
MFNGTLNRLPLITARPPVSLPLIPDDEIVSMMSAFEKRQGAPFSLVTPAAFLNLFRNRHGFVLALRCPISCFRTQLEMRSAPLNTKPSKNASFLCRRRSLAKLVCPFFIVRLTLGRGAQQGWRQRAAVFCESATLRHKRSGNTCRHWIASGKTCPPPKTLQSGSASVFSACLLRC